jgi:hypothetical protein
MMNEHIYTASFFWSTLAPVSQAVNVALPLVIFLSAVTWIYRVRSAESYVGLVGGLSVLLAHVCHFAVSDVRSIYLGGGMQPTVEQDPFIYFFYVHGNSFGLLIFFLAFGIFQLRKRGHA